MPPTPTTYPTSMPIPSAGEGMLYALCLGALLVTAGFFPFACAAAVHTGRRWPAAAAAVMGLVGLTAALVLSKPVPGMVVVAGLYFVVALAGVLVYGAIRRGRMARATRREG